MANCHAHDQASPATASVKAAIGFGLLGAFGLLLLYFGLLTALSGWSFTLDQFGEFWPFVVALAVGFGLQVGLFTTLHRSLHANGSGKVVAATGTTSGLAMLSCCAHYLVGLLPALGTTGLVTVVSEYQAELFWFGLVANLAGIVFISRRLLAIRNATALAVLIALIAITTPWSALAGSLPAQVNKEGKVAVEVTPLALTGETWRFQVQFDTHVVTLDHDPRAIATLAGPDGHEIKPTSWEGDPPGGHHRKGVLVFPALNPAPSTITIRIRDVGPIPERSFTWTLGTP